MTSLNPALIKLNQIGTVTETLEAMAICRVAGYRQLRPTRSGETEDDFIADLAVGTGCGHLKDRCPGLRRSRGQGTTASWRSPRPYPPSATACP